jgi:hypothetical protein
MKVQYSYFLIYMHLGNCDYTVINRQHGGELHENEGGRNCVYIGAYSSDIKSEVW